MTVRYSEVGLLGSPYYEKLAQNGVNTPADLRKRGIYLDNPYDLERLSQRNSKVGPLFWTKDRKFSIEIPDSMQNARAWLYIDTNEGTAPSYASLVSALADDWSDKPIDFGMYLSPEGRESAELVYKRMSQLAKGVVSLRKGNFGGFLREIRPLPRRSKRASYEKFSQGDLSSAFLEAHLGWSPIISDIYALSQPITDWKLQSESVSGRLGDVGRSIIVSSSMGGVTPRIEKAEYFRVHSLKAKVLEIPTLAERLGMGDPARIAWELVPLSFVADYFLPIGDTLAALKFITSKKVNRALRSTYQRMLISASWAPGTMVWSQNGMTFYNTDSVSYYDRQEVFSRRPHKLDLSECRKWNFTTPTSATRLATMSALLHQSILNLGRR